MTEEYQEVKEFNIVQSRMEVHGIHNGDAGGIPLHAPQCTTLCPSVKPSTSFSNHRVTVSTEANQIIIINTLMVIFPANS